MPPGASREGRHGLAIVLIAKNEGRHIREWASFHARAGARAFFVYDDGSTDSTVPILRDALGAAVTVIPWAQRLNDAEFGREIHNQVLAYAHAASNFGGAFRWMSFIDVFAIRFRIALPVSARGTGRLVLESMTTLF